MKSFKVYKVWYLDHYQYRIMFVNNNCHAWLDISKEDYERLLRQLDLSYLDDPINYSNLEVLDND